MAIKNDVNITYNNYLQKISYASDVTDKKYIQRMILQLQQLSPLSIVLPSAAIFFAIDYSTRQYLFFSNPLGHHKAGQVIEGGLEFTIPLMSDDFFKTYDREVFPAVLSFIKNIQPEQHTDYLTSFNYKIKNTDKKNIDIYQRCIYITSKETGLPTHCIGMAIDISHLKKDNEIILSCEKRNKETGVIDLVEKKYFYPHYGDSFFTKQEKTILQYMTDGLNSKMIAFKLELSLKTIETHRSNMLRKTNSKNIVELIMFAVRNKML